MSKRLLQIVETNLCASSEIRKEYKKQVIINSLMDEIKKNFDEYVKVSEIQDTLSHKVIIKASIEIMREPKKELDRTTRAGHLEWCKRRAMEYVDNGDLEQAIASMISDLGKHQETADHPGIMLGLMFVNKKSKHSVAKYIKGFN